MNSLQKGIVFGLIFSFAIGILLFPSIVNEILIRNTPRSLIDTYHIENESQYILTGTVSYPGAGGFLISDSTGELFVYPDANFNCNKDLSGKQVTVLVSTVKTIQGHGNVPYMYKTHALRVLRGC